MNTRDEGAAFPPVPFGQGPIGEVASHGARLLRDGAEPRCEMCGANVVATHCKRICLRCGFMSGCSEGV